MFVKPEEAFGIIHLSDIHFSIDTSLKVDLFFNAIRDEFLGCSKIFFVISGDIANTGKASEYEKALDFFTDVAHKLQHRYPDSEIRYIPVPGNHDCNFERDTQLRQNAVNNVDYDSLGNDNSILETCLKVQSDFWDFYGLVCDSLPENKAYYRIKDKIGNKSICFHCFNTAWMSQKKETPSTLFFPVKKIPELKETSECDINISVYHHPVSWFNPNTVENNKREIQNTIDSLSSLQIVGHEHENELRRTENLDRPDSKTLCASGKIFYNSKNPDESGFQIFVFKTDSNSFHLSRFYWKGDLYQRYSQTDYSLEIKPKHPLQLLLDFESNLNRINIPLTFGENTVSLSDTYVYPDLDEMKLRDNERIDDYIDAESLLDSNDEATFLLEGESQIGKSALLNMLFQRFYKKGFYPLLLNGSDIKNDNIDRILHQSFIKQYNSIEGAEDRFKQLPKGKKVLLLDDMHTCSMGESKRQNLLQHISDLFGIKIITIDTAFSVLPQCQASFRNLKTYSIKPLGYSKRNILVEKYLKCKNSNFSDTDHFDRSREMFDKLCTILGDKLIPPYPVFILTILQSLEYTPLNTNETSYGYCYQTLIHLALNQVGVTKDHIDAYINFITELSFELFNSKSDSITETELRRFHMEYSKKFWAPNYDLMVSNLLKSKILKNDFGSLKSGYIYIHYFLTAKKIAEMIDTQEGKKIVLDLFENLHIERNANVLVFITHHTKNLSFIEESIFNAMIPFDGTNPITLEKDCNYHNLLQDVLKSIRDNVIEMRNPNKEREKTLRDHDNFVRKRSNLEEDDENIESDIKFRPFLQSFRAIEIVGQIIKNRKGSLEINTLKKMITELYLTAFRQIGFLGELIKDSKDYLAKRVEVDVKDRDSDQDIEEKIYRFLQSISLQLCLAVFTKIIHHGGVKELRDLYNEVAQSIGTPASKIVSFSINSYYDKINIKELKDLAKEFESNFVAMQIMRLRVKAYVYNNHVDYKLKQQIGSCLNMKVPVLVGTENKGY